MSAVPCQFIVQLAAELEPALVQDRTVQSGLGPSILDHCIVRIIDVATRRELYRHPKYHTGEITIIPATCGKPYTQSVHINGKEHANFCSYGKAAQYVAFMTGECTEQPQ